MSNLSRRKQNSNRRLIGILEDLLNLSPKVNNYITTGMETTSTLDKFAEEDIFNTVLRYGLFVGAIFQLICIGSSIFLPPTQETQGTEREIGEEQKQTADIINAARRQHKIRKLEKKKRR